jgi:hypothetical protein
MKNLKILTFGILLIGMSLTSCKKDADQQFQNAGNQQLQPDAQAQNKEKLFERSITVYNADKTNSTTLRFRAASKELLDKMPLDNTEFTLVKAPESAPEAKGVDAPAISDDKGYSAFSGKDASQIQNTNEKQVLPKDGIMIDLPSLPKTKAFSIEVKSKTLNNSATAQAASYSYYTFWYKSGYSKIQVTNLAYNNPIGVYFYYWYYPYWYYSGYHFTLYQNGWATYWYCNRTVGTYVYYNPGWWYRITFYPTC